MLKNVETGTFLHETKGRAGSTLVRVELPVNWPHFIETAVVSCFSHGDDNRTEIDHLRSVP